MKRLNRIVAGALAAAIAITCVEVAPAAAAEMKAKLTTAQQAPVTDLSARRRYGNAAAIAAFAAIAGTIASVAAAEQRRQEWEDYHRYGYYGGYGGYAPAPYPYRYHHRHYWQGW